MTTKISYVVAFITGLGMIFLGTRFLLSPEIAESDTAYILMNRETIHFTI